MLTHDESSAAQCRLNILAVLAYHQFPLDGKNLRILTCQRDRITAEPGVGAVQRLTQLVPLTFKPCELIRKLHGPTAVWTMREAVPFGSMQVTGHYSPAVATETEVAVTKHGVPLDCVLVDPRDQYEVLTWELDIDHANPNYLATPVGHQDVVHLFKGVAVALVHACEVAYPGKTDPFWIRRRLLKRGIQVPLVDPGQAV